MKPLDADQDIRSVLKKIRMIEIKTRHMVDSVFAGSYHSVFKGQGMNFEEVREYQPGDEIRSIDWNVTARFSQTFVKQFTEERELNVVLMVDLSASGNYGSVEHSKREIAAEISAVLALSAVRNNDKVGLILFTDQIELYIPPRKGRSHVLRIIREVLYFKPEGRRTDIGEALQYLNRVVARRSIVFLVSDFLSSGYDKSITLASRRHDLVALPVSDPMEEELPNIGKILIQDEETGEQIEVNTSSPRVREAFADKTRLWKEGLQRLLRKNNIDSIWLRTNEDYTKAMRGFFKTRGKRR